MGSGQTWTATAELSQGSKNREELAHGFSLTTPTDVPSQREAAVNGSVWLTTYNLCRGINARPATLFLLRRSFHQSRTDQV